MIVNCVCASFYHMSELAEDDLSHFSSGLEKNVELAVALRPAVSCRLLGVLIRSKLVHTTIMREGEIYSERMCVARPTSFSSLRRLVSLKGSTRFLDVLIPCHLRECVFRSIKKRRG